MSDSDHEDFIGDNNSMIVGRISSEESSRLRWTKGMLYIEYMHQNLLK